MRWLAQSLSANRGSYPELPQVVIHVAIGPHQPVAAAHCGPHRVRSESLPSREFLDDIA